jgi:hypothetical protein
VVSPLAFLLLNSFLVPSLGYDVVPARDKGEWRKKFGEAKARKRIEAP